jgi:hypothetical protein
MDLRKYEFTTSGAPDKKKRIRNKRKEEYKKKRERKFQTSWLDEFPGLLYAVPFNEKGEESQSPSQTAENMMI